MPPCLPISSGMSRWISCFKALGCAVAQLCCGHGSVLTLALCVGGVRRAGLVLPGTGEEGTPVSKEAFFLGRLGFGFSSWLGALKLDFGLHRSTADTGFPHDQARGHVVPGSGEVAAGQAQGTHRVQVGCRAHRSVLSVS